MGFQGRDLAMKDSRSWLPSLIVASVVLICWSGHSRAEDIPPLSKDIGPFVVRAGSFRGPDAERLARALALELRKTHDLPVFLYQGPKAAVAKAPEFAVFVGNAKTLPEGKVLQQRIKKIEPVCFANTAHQKAGLTKALCLINPLMPGSGGCTLPRPVHSPVKPH
jgi:hypothetical protein